jgi:hypothetical protein
MTLIVRVSLLTALATMSVSPSSGTTDIPGRTRLVPDLAARQIRFLASTTTADDVSAQIDRFTAMGSRIPGYAGSEQAYRYVYSRFRALGLERVRTDTFEVVVPVDTEEGEISISGTGGRQLRAWCLWPNGVRTSTTKPGGIVAPLVNGASGSWGDLDGKPVEGSVVLLDFGSGRNWVHAASLGARAIVFYDNGKVTREQAADKFLSVSADLPRFWVDRESAEMMLRRIAEEQEKGLHPSVRLTGRTDWKSVPAYNVYGWIPGVDDNMPSAARQGGQKWRDKVIVVQAYYDAMSVVPALAPGSESAASIVALLEVAESLARYRPDCTILFLATSAHFTGMEGINDFLFRHSRGSEHFRQRLDEADIIDFDLMLSLDLSSGGDRTASVIQGDLLPSDSQLDSQAELMMARFSDRLSLAVQQIFDDSLCHLDGLSAARRQGDSLLPIPLSLASESALFVGKKALTVVTADDERRLWDTPMDTPSHVDFANLAQQIQKLTAMVMWASKDPLLLQATTSRLRDSGHSLAGNIYRMVDEAARQTPEPVPGALVTYQHASGAIGGVRTMIVDRADHEGRFHFGIMRNRLSNTIKAYEIDDETGAIISAPDRGVAGDEKYPMEQNWGRVENEMRQVLFGCRPLNLFFPNTSRHQLVPHNVTVVNTDDDVLQQWGFDSAAEQATADEPLSASLSASLSGATVIFAPQRTWVSVAMRTRPAALSATLRAASRDLLLEPVSSIDATELSRSQGRGYPIDKGVLVYPMLALAQDMWAADGERLRLLAGHGMADDRLVRLHENGRQSLLVAAEHFSARRFSAANQAAGDIWDQLAPVHADIASVIDATVASFMFHFLLLLPFAYAIERALWRSDDRRKQGFLAAAIFIAMALWLRSVHPVFALQASVGAMFSGLAAAALASLVLVVALKGFVHREDTPPRRWRLLLVATMTTGLILLAQTYFFFVTDLTTSMVIAGSIGLILLTALLLSRGVCGGDPESGSHHPGTLRPVFEAFGFAVVGIVLSSVLGQSALLYLASYPASHDSPGISLNLATSSAVSVSTIFLLAFTVSGVYQAHRQAHTKPRRS